MEALKSKNVPQLECDFEFDLNERNMLFTTWLQNGAHQKCIKFQIRVMLCSIVFLPGASRAPKVRGAKCPILPHFSENSSFIAFLCDNFFGFWKSGGAAAPLDPVDTRPLPSNTLSFSS